MLEDETIIDISAVVSFYGNENASTAVALDGINDTSLISDANEVPIVMQVVSSVAYIAICVLAIGGNAVVCYIVVAYQQMRTVTNFFFVNLAVGDILMTSLCIPFTFIANVLLLYWPFGSVMCPIVSYAQAVSVFVSAYTLVAISIDRYIAIIYPLKPRITRLQVKIIIVLVWTVALVTPLPIAMYSTLLQPPDWESGRYVCTEIWANQDQKYYYSMILMILQYFLPLFVLVFTYTRIALVVWGKTAPGEAEDSRDQRLAASKRKQSMPDMDVLKTMFGSEPDDE